MAHPPTLVVEDGTGKSDANTYVDFATAEEYFHSRFGDENVDELSGTVGLISAADYLDQRYGDRWKGYRTKASQSLSWPRSGVTVNRGPNSDEIADDVVPQLVKNAQMYLAYQYVQNGELSPAKNVSNRDGLKRLKADVLELEYKDDVSGDSALPYFTAVEEMLKPLLVSGVGSSTLRVVRV